jgi:hypothetical protein
MAAPTIREDDSIAPEKSPILKNRYRRVIHGFTRAKVNATLYSGSAQRNMQPLGSNARSSS